MNISFKAQTYAIQENVEMNEKNAGHWGWCDFSCVKLVIEVFLFLSRSLHLRKILTLLMWDIGGGEVWIMLVNGTILYFLLYIYIYIYIRLLNFDWFLLSLFVHKGTFYFCGLKWQTIVQHEYYPLGDRDKTPVTNCDKTTSNHKHLRI